MTKYKIAGLLVSLLVLAAVGLGVAAAQAEVFVHHPPLQRFPPDESPADYGLDYEDITLTTEDGYNLIGWYVPSRNQAAVIVQHGYKGDREDVLQVAEILGRHGYGVILVDLRAHGESDGDVITFGRYETLDVEAAYRYLLTRPDVDPERIGELGISLGGVVVLLHTAQNPAIKAVVAESAFVSLEDEVWVAVARSGLPALFLAPAVQYFAERETGIEAADVAPINYVGSISPRPVLLLQGGADDLVSPDSGQQLYDAAGEPRELWFEPDVGHAAFSTTLAEEYETRVVAFFDRYLLLQE